MGKLPDIVPNSDLEELKTTLSKMYKRESLPYSFFRGIFAGLGTALGATLILGLLGYFLSRIELIPLIGGWLAGIINEAIGGITPPNVY